MMMVMNPVDGINPDDGKQPKTFGFDLLILQFLTF